MTSEEREREERLQRAALWCTPFTDKERERYERTQWFRDSHSGFSPFEARDQILDALRKVGALSHDAVKDMKAYDEDGNFDYSRMAGVAANVYNKAYDIGLDEIPILPSPDSPTVDSGAIIEPLTADMRNQIGALGTYTPRTDRIRILPMIDDLLLTELTASPANKDNKDILYNFKTDREMYTGAHEGQHMADWKLRPPEVGRWYEDGALSQAIHDKRFESGLENRGADMAGEWIERVPEWSAIARELGFRIAYAVKKGYMQMPKTTKEIREIIEDTGMPTEGVEQQYNALLAMAHQHGGPGSKEAAHMQERFLATILKDAEEGLAFKPSDEELKTNTAEEDKLIQAAIGYKGTDNIRDQLLAEAATDGYTGTIAQSIVDNVLKRLQNTETGRRGNAFGVAHKPKSQTQRLASVISGLKSF